MDVLKLLAVLVVLRELYLEPRGLQPKPISLMTLVTNFLCSFSVKVALSVSCKHLPTAMIPFAPPSGQSTHTLPFLPTATSNPPCSFSPTSSSTTTPSFLRILAASPVLISNTMPPFSGPKPSGSDLPVDGLTQESSTSMFFCAAVTLA